MFLFSSNLKLKL